VWLHKGADFQTPVVNFR